MKLPADHIIHATVAKRRYAKLLPVQTMLRFVKKGTILLTFLTILTNNNSRYGNVIRTSDTRIPHADSARVAPIFRTEQAYFKRH